MNEGDLIRFQKKIELDILTGCWLWKGAKIPKGYGSFGMWPKVESAHRVSYEHWNGPIPEGMQIDHICRTRECVNPQHLEVVTLQENVKRGLTGKINNWNGSKTHCPKGHEYNEKNTHYSKYGRQCRLCRLKVIPA